MMRVCRGWRFISATAVLLLVRLQAGVSNDWIALHEGRLQTLVSALDPKIMHGQQTLPGQLSAVVEWIRGKEWPEALVSLVEIPDGDPGPAVLAEAEAALAGRFIFQSVEGVVPLREGGGLDWHWEGPRDDREWAWFLNRHGFFRSLVAAWSWTGRAAYAQRVDELWRDWLDANPYPGRFTLSAPWRALEVARRIESSWITTLLALRNSPFLSDETLLLVLSSLLEHADSLERFHTPGGNHKLTENAKLVQLAVFFPEFTASSRWLETGLRNVERLAVEQVYPDGSYKELANHYQLIATSGFESVYELCVASGRSEAGLTLRDTLERMWGYIHGVMRPSGLGPLNNDSDLDSNRDFLRRSARRFKGIEAAHGLLETPSESVVFPWAGHVVSRSGAGDESFWGFFDLGPLGTQHDHADRSHFSAAIGDQSFLVDPGRYTYKPGRMRAYFRGPGGHNLVTIDGLVPASPPREVSVPLPICIEQVAGVVFYGGQVAHLDRFGMERGRSVRWVGHLPLTGWIVVDEITVNGPRRARHRWLFHPDVTVRQDGGVLLASNGDRMLLLATTGARDLSWKLVRGRSGLEPEGWFSPSFNVLSPATAASCEELISGTSRLTWLIGGDLDALQLLGRVAEQFPADAGF